jgi:hypothetical protein
MGSKENDKHHSDGGKLPVAADKYVAMGSAPPPRNCTSNGERSTVRRSISVTRERNSLLLLFSIKVARGHYVSLIGGYRLDSNRFCWCDAN